MKQEVEAVTLNAFQIGSKREPMCTVLYIEYKRTRRDEIIFGFGRNTHPKRAKTLSSRMQLRLFVEEHLGLGTRRLLRSHDDAGFLSDVVVE